MNLNATYDPVEIKRLASGRWLDLLQSVGGLTAEQLNGRNQPCPKCGGNDRFAAFHDVAETGGVNCRKCHSERNGDGFATLQWATGKTFGQVLVEVANRVGVQPTTNGHHKKANGKPKLGPIVATYDYRDENGTLLFQATRHEPKDFRQRAPKVGGGWVNSIVGVRLVPYHLRKLLDADITHWVLIVEGEKDVESLERIGFVATCNPMGAGKWRDEFSELLRGRMCAVIPDADEPGAAHAAKVVSSLLRHNCRVRVVTVRSGKDVSDWIAAGGTRDSIIAAIEAATDCELGGEDDEPAAADKPDVTTLSDEMRQALERKCSGSSPLVTTGMPLLDKAIGGGFAYGEIVIIAARPSHGKSAVGLQLIHHLSELGIGCAFCSEEMTNEMVGDRALQFVTDVHKNDWSRERDYVSEDIENYITKRAPSFVIRKTGNLDKLLEIATGLIESRSVRVVIVDYAQQLAEYGRKQYDAVTEVSKRLTAFARSTGVLLVALCQHSRDIEKRESSIPRNTDLRESGQLEQDADVILHLVWPWMINNKNPKDEYQIYVGKNRNRPIEEKVVHFTFEPHRQRIVGKKEDVTKHPAYNGEFKDYNDGEGKF